MKKANRYILIGAFATVIVVAISLGIALPLRFKSKSSEIFNATDLLEKYPLIDGHNDLAYMLTVNFAMKFSNFDLNDDLRTYNSSRLIANGGQVHTDISRLRAGKLGGQFWSVYSSCKKQGKDAVRIHLEQIDLLQRVFKRYPDVFKFATTAAEVREAFMTKKIASLFGVESGHAIDSSLAMLRIYRTLGVRYMTLTHNCNTPWADNNLVDSNTIGVEKHGGLTEFGRKVVREMNRLGIIVDLSHVARKTMLDALEISKAPVIFSHSSIYSLCAHVRNVRDDVLLKLKANNGVIMITFVTTFVACSPNGTVDDVIAHLNYARQLIGPDHIGIGADYDGVRTTPKGVEDVSKYPDLFQKLLDAGWSQTDLIKLAGGNILRVLEDNENYANSVKETIQPDDNLIDQSDVDQFKNCRSEKYDDTS